MTWHVFTWTVQHPLVPAKAGTHAAQYRALRRDLDSRLRGNERDMYAYPNGLALAHAELIG